MLSGPAVKEFIDDFKAERISLSEKEKQKVGNPAEHSLMGSSWDQIQNNHD